MRACVQCTNSCWCGGSGPAFYQRDLWPLSRPFHWHGKGPPVLFTEVEDPGGMVYQCVKGCWLCGGGLAPPTQEVGCVVECHFQAVLLKMRDEHQWPHMKDIHEVKEPTILNHVRCRGMAASVHFNFLLTTSCPQDFGFLGPRPFHLMASPPKLVRAWVVSENRYLSGRGRDPRKPYM